MIRCHHQRRRSQHFPIAVAGQKRQRTEDMKMGFNSTSGQMDQQRRKKHLRNCDRVACQETSWLFPDQKNRKTGNCSTQKNCRPDVPVHVTGCADPGPRRNPEGGANPSQQVVVSDTVPISTGTSGKRFLKLEVTNP